MSITFSTRSSAQGRREALIDCTRRLMLQRGLGRLTTREITEASGVSTGLLSHYFRWIDLRALAWESIFHEAITPLAAMADEPKQAMQTWIQTAFAPEEKVYWRLWIEATELAASGDAPLADAISRQERAFLSALELVLRNGKSRKLWSLSDPAGTALRLSALFDGLAGKLMSMSTSLSPAEAKHHLTQAFAAECSSQLK